MTLKSLMNEDMGEVGEELSDDVDVPDIMEIELTEEELKEKLRT